MKVYESPVFLNGDRYVLRKNWSRFRPKTPVASQNGQLHFGNSAFIFNDAYNVAQVTAVLNRFNPASIRRLFIGGHGTYIDGIGVQPTNNNTLVRDAAEGINNTTILASMDAVNAISSRLAANGEIEFQSCGGGKLPAEVGSLPAKRAAAQTFANRIGHRVWYVIGSARGWDSADLWESRSPE